MKVDKLRPSLYLLVATVALIVGAVLGLRPQLELGSNAQQAARVNGRAISQLELQRAIEAVAADSRESMTQAERKAVLERLIDENLLLDYAMSLDLARQDRAIRKQLIQTAMTAFAKMDTITPSENELYAYWQKNTDYFKAEQRFALQAYTTSSREQADDFRSHVELGVEIAQAATKSGLKKEQLPAVLLERKLDQFFGSGVAKRIRSMQDGELVGPIDSQQKKWFVWLLQRTAPDFEFSQNLQEIERAWRVQQKEAAFLRLLKRLRNNARIEKYL